MSRTVSLELAASRGRGVWALLCRSALQGIEYATQLFGLESLEGAVEHAERLARYAAAPAPLPYGTRPIDWAKLGEFERGRVSREVEP